MEAEVHILTTPGFASPQDDGDSLTWDVYIKSNLCLIVNVP